MKIFFYLYLFLFFISCQPIEKTESLIFDNDQFSKFNILSNSIDIKLIFEKKISNPYIGHTLDISPSERIINWVNDNFRVIGNENKFEIRIIDASLTQTHFENEDANNFDEKTNYKYELFYLVEFNLYENYGNLIASTIVESNRSTTSGQYISIEQKENIINDLVYQSLNDLSKESQRLLIKYMGDYLV
tara:strand:+ start:340 stop:906 length:567 start_codon:yes stop_codon:yes gene_type:complete